MHTELILQFIFNGLIAGSMYALVATGFSLIYATNRFMHFAHGGVVITGGYIFFVALQKLALPVGAALFVSAILSTIFGIGLYKGIYQPLEKRGSSSAVLLIVSIALMILIQNTLQLVFGPSVVAVGIATGNTITIAGATMTTSQLVLLTGTLVLLFATWVGIKKSRIGSSMRAVADNPELAEITGIDTNKIKAYSFGIGSGIAGIAGALIGIEQNLIPTMGFMLIIKGFTGAVIGGVTSVPGAVLGSMLVGLAENIGILWFPSGYKDAIAFILLFVFLLARPTGILGINKGIKK